MQIRFALFVLILHSGAALSADTKAPDFVKLWPDAAPGQDGTTDKDIPAIQIYQPTADKATGTAIVVCPGGGYGGLAAHEGPKVGEWLQANGILGVVLRYRLGPKYHHPVELGDAQRAIRYTRAHAAEWKIDPKHIGILGFSAGGHLASTASTHYTQGDEKSADPIERVSSRPDFSVLIYPVVTMGLDTHTGSRNNLLGKDPDPKLIELLSNEKQVNAQTPRAFVVHGINDKAVKVSNSYNYVEALKKAGVAVEYIRLDDFPHGKGMQDSWTGKCLEWLKKIGMTK